ncbi:DNA topoisomerase IV, alpha subunit [Aureobasidium pullulans EXF-150]|uniref:DNA topoisomerase (ATP-hydrolyzing) n=1 Tax=Aureobasidium pullulans EXF-150 TaxID=1043002 RepID=A0A074XS94_AURPU|nr:DNA topoisomerase IV, alpha subunit [Aureobasidium pullulans EXF-150]KEQ86509.1 DNA topoisomerase IV, alpha subunit [Aureobasidium pullulans EXF-150]
MDDEFDHDMLFEFESPVASPGSRDAFLLDAPQLSRQTKHNDVIAQIEAVFETVADALLNERADITVSLAAHSTSSQDDPSTRGPKATFTFPGKNASDAWRFSVVIRILELIHESLSDGVILTKRDLYYRDPALFGKQATVDRYVDQIAAAFAVPRSSLNVTAGVKGLMAGAAVIHRRDGSKIGLTNVQNGVLVPSMEEVLSVDLSRVRWILVVEKEATFQSIISSEFWQEMMWHAVIVTGKGYPDIATRAIARFMSIASPQNGFAEPPVFGLVDYDPDGMAILHTYKHGSKKMSEDNAALIVPTTQWMGLRSRDITDEDHTHRNQGLMPLTRRDRHKARKMLEWEQFSDLEEAAQWRRELQVMLMLNLKAEIQIIDSDPSGLAKMIKYAVKDT